MSTVSASLLLTVVLATLLMTSHGARDACTSRLDRGAVMCEIETNEKYTLHNVKANLCTHVLLVAKGFVWENGTVNTQRFVNSFLKNVTDLDALMRLKSPNTKVGIRIGEFDYETDYELFRYMALNADRRKNFVDSLLSFMRKYELNVVAVNLEQFQTKGLILQEDWSPFKALVEAISRVVRARGWQMGLGLSGFPDVFYDPVVLAKTVDFIDVTVSYYSARLVNHTGFLTPIETDDPTDNYTVKHAVEEMVRMVGANCVVMNIPLFGLNWNVLNSAVEPGPGSFYGEPYEKRIWHRTTYNEICRRNKSGACSTFDGWDSIGRVPWAVCRNAFYAYENPRSVEAKVDLSLQMGIKGVSLSSIDNDDYKGDCGRKDYPILRAAQKMRRAANNN